ncbi:MAG TPA: GNAT family N-acetyltransferase [Chloroflexota bacterium]|nr:GNAT family N-acetyltransferase [Chloroflexota bacterium]
MPDIVPAIIPATIATVIEANINAYLLSFARVPGATPHHDPQSVWIDSGRSDSTFNSVVSARFSPDTVDAQIESVLAHFQRHARPLTWHIGPSSTPSDLGRILLAHGLTHSEDEPGMAVELSNMREDITAPSGLEVETVRDAGGLEDWVAIWLFPVPAEIRQSVLEVLRVRGVGADLPWRYYVGRIGGRPVACSELFVGEGTASVQYVVTLPEMRRQGIGAAMTLHVLREAREIGYRVGVLTASPDGIGIYRRIGFQDYCWFRRYEWSPSEESAKP